MALTRLNKYAADSRKYNFDFSNVDEISGGQTISSVVGITSTPSDLTIGSGVISGSKVQTRLSAGTDGETYRVACQITTSGGDTVTGVGLLFIDTA